LSCLIIPDQGAIWENLAGVSASVALGLMLYIFFSFLVKSPELEYIFYMFKKRRG